MGRTASQGAAAGLRHALIAALAACSPFVTAAAPNKPSGCLIEPEQVAEVGSPVTGIIESLPVALGDEVVAGQTLATLRADVERANAQVAQLRSQVDADARAAQANLILAQQKVNRTRQLMTQNFVSAQAVDQAVAEAEVADQKYKLARSQLQIYQQEQNVAKAQLGLRTLRSPISGVVVERYNNLGERVDDRPVLRVASIDPLRVSLMIPIAQYGQIRVGSTMVIRPELPGIAPLNATVKYVDKVVDAASNTFRVRLILPNPSHRLPGGLRCKAELQAGGAAVSAAPAATRRLTPALPAPARPVAVPTRWAPAAPAAVGMILKTSWQLSAPRQRGTPENAGSGTRVPGAPGATASSPPLLDQRLGRPFTIVRGSQSLQSGSAMWLTASLSLARNR